MMGTGDEQPDDGSAGQSEGRSMGVMCAVELSHFALLVRDIDEAIFDVGAALGITFADPVTIASTFRAPDGSGAVEARLRISYSRQGPPYCELIQPLDDVPVFSAAELGQVHHIGGYVPDLAGSLDEIVASADVETLVCGPDGAVIAAYTTRSLATFGTRVEYLDETRKAVLERWARTGVRE